MNLPDSQAPSTALLLLKPIDDEVVVRLVVWNRAQFEALKLVPSEIAVVYLLLFIIINNAGGLRRKWWNFAYSTGI